MLDLPISLDEMQLRYYPDPVLRHPAESIPLTELGPHIASLADWMIDIMVQNSGIGLAAPQIGLPLRIVVISLTGKKQDAEVFVNPEISNFQGMSEVEEGCLSLPGIRAKVRRPAACTVTAMDLDGNTYVTDAVDLAATVIQHETDHLNGTLFIDRISSVSRLACRKTIKQLEKDFSSGQGQ
ncbi:MAG: peptide deformylase [Sedimentisphaerales bacterium]|nr:peptide deformylase [Sedimentisphaerales bacterium]